MLNIWRIYAFIIIDILLEFMLYTLTSTTIRVSNWKYAHMPHIFGKGFGARISLMTNERGGSSRNGRRVSTFGFVCREGRNVGGNVYIINEESVCVCVY